MLLLLRKLRRGSLRSAAFWKYILYALGEIALVVIGILIALQVDSWVETRKARAFEIKMVTEVRDACLRDARYFEMLGTRLDILEDACRFFVNAIGQGMTAEDIEPARYYNLRYGIRFQYNVGPYEAIKSTGLDRISNDRIREAMVEVYDFELPRSRSFMENVHEVPYRLEDRLWGEIISDRVEPVGESEEYRLVPYFESPDILKDPRFLKILKLASQRSEWSRIRLESPKEVVLELASLIEAEFAREGVDLPSFEATVQWSNSPSSDK